MKSRTPSDFAIVAIFRDKRKPQNAVGSAFPLDFMGIFQCLGGPASLLQSGSCRPKTHAWQAGQINRALLSVKPRFYALHETAARLDRIRLRPPGFVKERLPASRHM
jgi:hypothetical protein